MKSKVVEGTEIRPNPVTKVLGDEPDGRGVGRTDRFSDMSGQKFLFLEILKNKKRHSS